ncbi:hypothetical protein [Methylobacterium sp. Leaf466]|uniref:hypothetical protein n=1 Tax=Methylobacterium sp. Leaf466 TaxID=1736386 RepID=UPI0012E33612|nr:hypothetical protein [Methylobacterium sp. Leaf466]
MSHSTVSIPTARAHQFRLLARHHEVPAADLLDEFIRGSWDHAGFEFDLPPFDMPVGRDDATGEQRVFLSTPGADVLDFSADQAHAVANGIMALLAGSASRFVVAARCAGRPGGLVGERRGRGYTLKIAGNLDGVPRAAVVSLTRSVANDLARILEDRASKAAKAVS